MNLRTLCLYLCFIAVGLLIVITSGRGTRERDDGAAESERLERCKQFIRDRVLDPSAVKWNGHRTEKTADKTWFELDFTAPNAFGGPVRKKWAFSFDDSTGWMEWESEAEEAMRQLMRD